MFFRHIFKLPLWSITVEFTYICYFCLYTTHLLYLMWHFCHHIGITYHYTTSHKIISRGYRMVVDNLNWGLFTYLEIYLFWGQTFIGNRLVLRSFWLFNITKKLMTFTTILHLRRSTHFFNPQNDKKTINTKRCHARSISLNNCFVFKEKNHEFGHCESN